MKTLDNPIKSSAAALAFFMSSAAWVASSADFEAQVPELPEPGAN